MLKVIDVLSAFFLPVLVVIIKAPFDAREPYNAAAAGPLSTVTEAISSGSISFPLLPKSTLDNDDAPLAAVVDAPPIVLVLSIGTPSITINAWLFPAIDDPPLSTILDELPGVFEEEEYLPQQPYQLKN